MKQRKSIEEKKGKTHKVWKSFQTVGSEWGSSESNTSFLRLLLSHNNKRRFGLDKVRETQYLL